jgi:threonine/homoserine/homoserine lactone efflux protein
VSVSFLVTSLVICVSPGVGALYTVSSGLARGARAGLVAAVGCTLGIIPHLLAAATGLAALLHASGLAFQGLRIAGVGYLLWMAWSTWRDTGALTVRAGEDQRSGSTAAVVVKGITLNLLNPKLTIFFFAFMPQFVPTDAPALGAMLRLSAVFMAMTFVVFAVYALFAASLHDRFLARPRLVAGVRKLFAVSFVGVGIQLALSSDS